MSAPATIRPSVVHDLKVWPGDFESIRVGRKTCEIRRCDDRKFVVGDVLTLREFDPNKPGGEQYSGRLIRVRVTHVDRMAGPRMIAGIGRSSLDDVVPLAALSFVGISS